VRRYPSRLLLRFNVMIASCLRKNNRKFRDRRGDYYYNLLSTTDFVAYNYHRG